MARLSDFQIPSPGRNLVAEALVDANAAKVHRNIAPFTSTRIILTQGAAESTPYLRDAALAGVHRRKRFHTALDKLCCDLHMTDEEAKPIHEALDRHLDDDNPAGADPNAPLHEPAAEQWDLTGPEPLPESYQGDEPEENERHEYIKIPAQDMHRALDAMLDLMERRRKKTRRATSKDRSMAMDSQQRSQGGGCGRSYACDVGNLSAANYIRIQKRERVGKVV
jgi:hypothetical protein